MKSIKLLSSLAFGASALALVLAAPASAQTKEPLKVGALMSMTGSGASVGAASLLGLRMAISEINAAGGILGRQVQIVQGDDGTDTTNAVTEAKRLVYQDKVQIMFGPQFSPPTLAVAAAVAKAETSITYWSLATASALTPELARTVFSFGPSGDALADAMVDYALNTRKAKAVGFLYDDAQQSAQIYERIKELMKEAKRDLVAVEQYQLNAPDVTPQLLNLRRKGADFVLLQAQSPIDTATVMKNTEQLGWDVKFAGNNGAVVNFPVMAKNAGPTAIKALVAGVSVKAFSACASDPLGQSDYVKYTERLKKFEPNMNPQIGLTTVVQYYDMAYLAKAVAEAVGSTDGMKMTEMLEQNPGKFKTIVAPVLRTSKTNHFLATSAALTMAEDMGNVRADGLYKRAGC